LSHRRNLTDDLLLPEFDTAQTVQVGHSPLPFDEADCELPVRIAEIRLPAPREESVETLMVPRRSRALETAPTVLLEAAKEPVDPSGLLEPAAPPQRSSMMFVLVLIAISLASAAAGMLLANQAS
jgi:hypothetical protein